MEFLKINNEKISLAEIDMRLRLNENSRVSFQINNNWKRRLSFNQFYTPFALNSNNRFIAIKLFLKSLSAKLIGKLAKKRFFY